MIIMNEIPDRANMISQFFGKGQGFTHETATGLTKGVVEAFNRGGSAGFLAHRAVTFGRENGSVGSPKIGVTDSALTLDRRQGLP